MTKEEIIKLIKSNLTIEISKTDNDVLQVRLVWDKETIDLDWVHLDNTKQKTTAKPKISKKQLKEDIEDVLEAIRVYEAQLSHSPCKRSGDTK